MNTDPRSAQTAIGLLHGLVSIPSLSTQENAASAWLVDRMAQLGYDLAYVDEAGNAVGEIGDPGTERIVILLGHIDTVPGDISVRVEQVDDGSVLYGRGSVDAKGPLATFAMAAARLGSDWARQHNLRLVVIGAVEEEAATSRGARHIKDRYDGNTQPLPLACIIGEPSGWNRITMGYKGRLLVELTAGQPMAHTAGPDAGVATRVVHFWNWLESYAAEYNAGRERLFDQLQPSLREVRTAIDDAMNDTVWARAGIRIPVGFEVQSFTAELVHELADFLHVEPEQAPVLQPGMDAELRMTCDAGWIVLRLRGYEPAWRSDRQNGLVRAFLGAIREHGERPGFVVKTGTSDMNVVGPNWLCPILAYGPGDSSLDHTPNEHLSLQEYANAIDILEDALCRLPHSL